MKPIIGLYPGPLHRTDAFCPAAMPASAVLLLSPYIVPVPAEWIKH